MDLSKNSAFLRQQFPFAADSASRAERHVYGDPRASCFYARHSLERLIMRVFKIDKTLIPPGIQMLSAYVRDPAFRALLPAAVLHKIEYVRDAGNVAVHAKKVPTPETALDIVRELHHVLYWAGRTYLRNGAKDLQGRAFDESLVPRVTPSATPASIEALEKVRAQLDASEDARRELESERDVLREQVAAYKAANAAVPDTHDWSEAKTRKLIIDLALHRAGWPLDQKRDREYEVTGMPNKKGVGYADYVLWGVRPVCGMISRTRRARSLASTRSRNWRP
jgi:type I restriction enzyme, R subunit